MSAEVNYDFAVQRWAKTMQNLSLNGEREEVEKRCAALPKAFEARLISYLQGEDSGAEY